MGLIRKIKFLFTVIVIIIIVYVIIKMGRLKPEIENMVKKEFSIAKKVFNFRDILYSTMEAEDINDNNIKTSKSDSKLSNAPRRKNNKISKYKREEICRSVFEEHYDDYFPTVRPNFLKNPKTGRALELDGYNAGLNLAFEYNGKQHRVFPNVFHETENEFIKQQERDKYKMKRCKELGINLIIIPDTVKTKNIKKYILSKLN